MGLIIFDLDGTLVDPLEAMFHGVQETCRELGFAAPGRVEVARYIGFGAGWRIGQRNLRRGIGRVGFDGAEKIRAVRRVGVTAGWREAEIDRRGVATAKYRQQRGGRADQLQLSCAAPDVAAAIQPRHLSRAAQRAE